MTIKFSSGGKDNLISPNIANFVAVNNLKP